MRSGHFFITGGTGILGRELIPRLLRGYPDASLSMLVRGRDDHEALGRRDDLARYLRRFHPGSDPDRIEVLRGDVTEPALGLDPDTREQLCASVTCFIHAAATIRLSVPRDCAQAVNLRGTGEALRLALSCRHLRRFAHVSTAFVAGRREGRILETELEAGQGFLNAYEQSKFEAEALVRRAMPRLPTTIFRPAVLVGDSRDGHIASQATLYLPLRQILEGGLRHIPGDPEVPLDLVPVDVAAEILVRLLDHEDAVGGTYHIVSGSAARITVRDFLRTAIERYGAAGPPIEFADPAAGATEAGNPFRSFFDYLRIPKEFDDSRLRDHLGGELPHRPHPAEYLHALLDFCRRTAWGTRSPWEESPCTA